MNLNYVKQVTLMRDEWHLNVIHCTKIIMYVLTS